MNTKIITICGESEIIPNFEDISSDPNFIFTPDASFGTKVLYDLDENVINVNSWLECANYVVHFGCDWAFILMRILNWYPFP